MCLRLKTRPTQPGVWFMCPLAIPTRCDKRTTAASGLSGLGGDLNLVETQIGESKPQKRQ